MMEKSLQQHCVVLDSCGPVSVYVQGEEKHLKTGVVFLTVHDVGSSYKNWLEFTSHPSMADVCKRAVFLHVCLPGQEPGAPDLPENYVFPKMRELGAALVTILDQLRVPRVVGLGEGAGANLVTRLAMMCPDRVHGIVAINNTATASKRPSFIDRMKMKLTCCLRNKEKGAGLNQKNLNQFVESYKKRSEILTELNKKIKSEVLLIVGMKSKYFEDSEEIHREMAPGLCSVIKIEEAVDPLTETPGKVSEAVFLLCQGAGLLPNVQSEVARRYSRHESTEESIKRRSIKRTSTVVTPDEKDDQVRQK